MKKSLVLSLSFVCQVYRAADILIMQDDSILVLSAI
jgi:hypothetical protein